MAVALRGLRVIALGSSSLGVWVTLKRRRDGALYRRGEILSYFSCMDRWKLAPKQRTSI